MRPGEITLRPARPEDAERVFAWRNRPEIVALGTTHATVSRETHDAWFAETLQGGRRTLYIIELAGEPAGQIRFDWGDAREAEVSIYLLGEYVGRGAGVAALREGCRLAAQTRRADVIVARIREDNLRSHAAFIKAGFTHADVTRAKPGHIVLIKPCGDERVPHNRLAPTREEARAVLRVVQSGHWAAGGELADFEARMARKAGVTHAVGVGSGLGAIRLSLLALGVGAHDRVAVPAYSCVALANAVLACGAEPVPVDVEPQTWNLSITALREALSTTPGIKAAIVVHTFGMPAPVRAIEALGVPVVEDCSHAFGIAPLGSSARVAMLSLYATKLLGAGEGGMVLTNHAPIADHIRAARDYSDQAPSARRLNDRPTDFTAALGNCQLERLPAMLARRTELAERYTAFFSRIEGAYSFELPRNQPGRVWYRYVVRVADAQTVVARLHEQGVVAACPVEDWGGASASRTPVSSDAYRQLVSLPLYPSLTDAEHKRVCSAFLDVITLPCAA